MQRFPSLLLLLDPEDVGSKSLETRVTLYPTTQYNISEDFYIHKHSCGHNLIYSYRIPSNPALLQTHSP
jgi:hypothetical protein